MPINRGGILAAQELKHGRGDQSRVSSGGKEAVFSEDFEIADSNDQRI